MSNFDYKTLFAFSKSIFIKMGCSEAHAQTASEVLLSADLRGVDSHGVARLSGYVRLWEKKRINATPDIKIVHETLSTATVDGDTGLGLVEKTNLITGLTQVDDSGITQGSIPFLQNVANINYAELPNGVSEWYNLIDRALKGTGTFLIPVQVIKTLDISEPIYVEKLGGFFIIERIEEYVDAQTLVKVHLIKLLDDAPVSEEPGAPSVINLVMNDSWRSDYQISFKLFGHESTKIYIYLPYMRHSQQKPSKET
jgi:hypothetical protein